MRFSAVVIVPLLGILIVSDTASAEPPVAVTTARTTTVPACTLYVDAAARGGAGTAQDPYKTIVAAVEAASPNAIICVSQGVYSEEIKPGDKPFTLAGGFQSRKDFKVRDSAKYVSHAKGKGAGSFLRIADGGPNGGLTAIDGFEISGYSQAIVRMHWESQRFDITNNYIHDNTCTDESLWGAGFTVNNVSGAVRGNVFRKNSCGRGGAGAINDETNQNTVVLESNHFDDNSGTEPSSAHGGALHIGANKLTIRGNLFTNNRVTQWGGGLYVGAYTQGNQLTTATLAWNVYRANRAGDSGGGFFCDEGATCFAEHEVYEGNCGGNVLVDGGAEGSGPTNAKFDHITVVGALNETCDAPGIGFWMDTYDAYAPDTYSISNAIFWGNADGQDVRATCGKRCAQLKLRIDNSMLQSKVAPEGVKVAFGANILPPADPLFVAPEQGDFRLQPNSPAIGKGANGADLGAYGKGSGTPPAPRPTPPAKPSPPPAPVAESAPQPTPDPQAAEAPVQKPKAPASLDAEASPQVAEEALSEKEAFAATKELGTVEAWNIFLKRFPTGFHAELARAYLNKLNAAAPAASASPPANPPAPKPAADSGAAKVDPSPAKSASAPPVAPPGQPAIARGADYMGTPEKFNRYYTDPAWKPTATVYVSSAGSGDGSSRDSPSSVQAALADAKPGTTIVFLPGSYEGGYELRKERSGTYDQPIVLFAERADDGSVGVKITCTKGTRQTCINLEGADYVAIDGFELIGGKYGVRAIGLDYPASKHSRGIAVMNNRGHDQDRDPFFSGQSDWNVWERNVGFNAKKGDGHGIYISNGSDWNIVRFNQTYGGVSSDFQINADPASACGEVGVPFDDPRCDAYAGEGEGGQGASDYFLVESNFFHHSIGPGANFTSVRRSVVRNNIFGPHGERHNTTFWQETDNPKLGSSDNKILHNLFITTGRHAIRFQAHSDRNQFVNNVVIGVKIEGGQATGNANALLMEVDDTVGNNVYRGNFYTNGRFDGREPNADETANQEFSTSWFARFPTGLNLDPNDLKPTSKAPFIGIGKRLPDAPFDLNGAKRGDDVDLGPIELP